ncbi:2-C-methyl-D-erythritol 4-phosphate cytidylyltransferase [Geminicoccus roseus]|uniref:2-C-methyl-D-erythritol 4-phosphate cytidylyltransferase n=1 Tax=Geminicoccus roseus TaxID=404900 RepID=UPI00047FC8FC|nr:2-C-methyl-D-erythritol 4-phosphate cytidylyltransferase [Geminicoccus roseus]
MPQPTCIVLVVAAGRGERFGSDLPKQYLDLLGSSVLRRAIHPFLDHPRITGVRAVIAPGHENYYQAAMAGLDLLPPVIGGATRQDSVLAGLEALAGDPPDLVLVHDAARPLVTRGLIDRVLLALDQADAALPGLPVVDSLRRVEAGRVCGEISRDGLVRAQTPQGFRFQTVLDAHRRHAGDTSVTDDVELVRRDGGQVAWVDGEEDNLKVTRSDDLAIAARTLGARPRRFASGLGFDIHATAPDRPLFLGGVEIPAPFGLAGHSDADVLLHALTDALLGTIGAGDIGVHFPPSDEQWRGAESGQFVRHALKLLAQREGRLEHADLSIMAERPKIGPHRGAIVARLQELLGLPPERIGLKAGTMEGLGAIGRQEGIAAQALVTVSFPA